MKSKDQEEAVIWVVRRDCEGSSVEAEFLTWIEESSGRQEAFRAALSMSTRLDRLDPHREIDVSELISRAIAERNLEPVPAERDDDTPFVKARPRTRYGWRYGGFALAVAAMVVVGWTSLGTRTDEIYTTTVGEQRVVPLTDGSSVHLNSGSGVKVSYTDKERRVSLLGGEALFAVERDPSRPFRVLTERTLVEVMGTRFDVNQRAARTTISVIAGEVSVLLSKGKGPPADLDRQQYAPPPGESEALKLAAGDQVSVGSDWRYRKDSNVDLSKVLLWQKKRLRFDDVPLAEVADEFNVYNTRRIAVEGEALRARPISGNFSVDHPETLFHYLQSKDPQIVVEDTSVNIILRTR